MAMYRPPVEKSGMDTKMAMYNMIARDQVKPDQA